MLVKRESKPGDVCGRGAGGDGVGEGGEGEGEREGPTHNVIDRGKNVIKLALISHVIEMPLKVFFSTKKKFFRGNEIFFSKRLRLNLDMQSLMVFIFLFVIFLFCLFLTAEILYFLLVQSS